MIYKHNENLALSSMKIESPGAFIQGKLLGLGLERGDVKNWREIPIVAVLAIRARSPSMLLKL